MMLKNCFLTDGLSTFPSVLVEKYSSTDFNYIKSLSVPEVYPCLWESLCFFRGGLALFCDMPHFYSVDIRVVRGSDENR